MSPNPNRDVLARWIIETFNIVKVIVIKSIENRLERRLNIRKVDHPAEFVIDGPRYMQLNAKRMSMQATALMALWNMRQSVRCFKPKFFVKFHCDCSGLTATQSICEFEC